MSINPHMEILKSLNYMFRIHCKVVRKARVASEGNKMFWELALFYGKSSNPEFQCLFGKRIGWGQKNVPNDKLPKINDYMYPHVDQPRIGEKLAGPPYIFFWQTPTVSTLLFPTSGHNPLREISPSLSMDFAGKSRGFLVLVDWSQTGSLGLVRAMPGEDFSLGDGLQSDHPYTCTCALTHLGVHQEQDSLETSWNIRTSWNHQLEFNHLKVGIFVVFGWFTVMTVVDICRYSYGWMGLELSK